MAERAVGPPAVRSVLRSGGRAVVVLVVIGIGVVGVALLTVFRGPGRTRRETIALLVLCRMTLRALGIRVVSQGSVRSGPSLVVANRLSWLDLLVLAAAGPMVPLADRRVGPSSPIAPIAARVGALFVGQGCCRQLPGSVQQVTATLRRGHRVLVFPGGDEQLGAGREPFHRAVFQAAIDSATVISPVAVSFSGPSVGSGRIDEAMSGLLWRTLRGGSLTVRVQWLPVIPAVAGPGHRSDHRAAAATRAQWAIDRALGNPPQGRQPTARTPALTLLPSGGPTAVASSGPRMEMVA